MLITNHLLFIAYAINLLQSKQDIYFYIDFNMGSDFNVLKTVDSAPLPASNLTRSHLTVATLNYCGIAFSPFEFYFKDYEVEIEKISKTFRKLIPVYV